MGFLFIPCYYSYMLRSKKFSRKIEDFQCENCGCIVKGDGYTDHCPQCLYSKHVDINPGDRACNCLGLMEPIGVELKSGQHIIHYCCLKCKKRHQVKANEKDDYETLVALSSNPIKDN